MKLPLGQTALATGVGPLVGSVQDSPSSHDGSSAFSVLIAFSEEVEITPEDMRDHALLVSGATVTDAARVDGQKDLWELTLQPSGNGPVSILTPQGRACTEAGAICTADGRPLTVGLGLRVNGPPPPQANSPATGAPGISGTAQVGETLTADTSGIADADGLTNVSYGYQWIANDGTSDTDITGATDSSHTLAAADEGRTIRVRVSFTDDGGSEETLTSAATAPVAPRPGPASAPDTPDQPTGTAVFAGGVDLEWDDVPGAGSYDVQLFRNGQWTDLPGDGVEIAFYGPGAIISELDTSSGYWFQVRASNAHGSSDWSEYLFMTSTNQYELGKRARPANVPACGAPDITGTAQAEETLTADTAGIQDGNGLDRVRFRFQWVSNDGSADTDIADAADSSYTVAGSDEGSTVRVRVSFTDRGGYAESLTSDPTGEVGSGVQQHKANRPATGAPTITGTAQVGEALTANTSGIADADGLCNAAFSYQWVANDGTADTDITGATASTHTLAPADLAHTARVRVSFTDDGYAETVTSDATAPVVRPANVPACGAPDITGTAQAGETLTAETYGIADDNGLANAAFTYKWVRRAGGADTGIPDAAGPTHLLTPADAGSAIKVRVSFTDDGYPETVTSDATAPVPAIVPPEEPETARATGDESIATATNLGTLNNGTTRRYSQSLRPPSDSVNYYKFVLTVQKDVQITVEEQETDDAVLQLVNEFGYPQDVGISQESVNSAIEDYDRIVWSILGAGTHYIKLSQTDATANYYNLRIEVRDSPLTNDDFGNGLWTTGTVAVGGSVNETINPPRDRQDNDWFRLEDLTTGLYDIRVKPHGPDPGSNLFFFIRDHNGQFLEFAYSGQKIHRFGGSGDFATTSTPQDLYLKVRGSPGGYTLSIKRRNYTEQEGADLPNDATTAGWVKVNHDPYPLKSGTITRNDKDAYRVDLVAGKSYRIDVKGNESAGYGGTLSDPFVQLLRHNGAVITSVNHVDLLNSGTTAGGIVNDNYGPGNNARLDITAGATGSYLISVKGSTASATGTYTLTVQSASLPLRGTQPSVSEAAGDDLPHGTGTTSYVQVNGGEQRGTLKPMPTKTHSQWS